MVKDSNAITQNNKIEFDFLIGHFNDMNVCVYSQDISGQPVWLEKVRRLILTPATAKASWSWLMTSSGSVLLRANTQAKSI